MPHQDLQTRLSEIALTAMRVVFGLAFMQHGAQKLFAVLGREEAVELFSRLGLAGTLEFWGGLLIVVGLLTRPVAFILCGEMAVAFFTAHFPRGGFPIQNGGELPMLYCFAWLYLAARGGGPFSVDGILRARRGARAAGATPASS